MITSLAFTATAEAATATGAGVATAVGVGEGTEGVASLISSASVRSAAATEEERKTVAFFFTGVGTPGRMVELRRAVTLGPMRGSSLPTT